MRSELVIIIKYYNDIIDPISYNNILYDFILQ